MVVLAPRVSALMEFLRRTCPTLPATVDVLVFEHPSKPVRAVDGKVRIARSDLMSVERFEERFTAIIEQKPPWINLSAVGVEGDRLVISIEASPSEGSPRTSINFSGPTSKAVLASWSAATDFEFV